MSPMPANRVVNGKGPSLLLGLHCFEIVFLDQKWAGGQPRFCKYFGVLLDDEVLADVISVAMGD